jgi:hypothetical protein
MTNLAYTHYSFFEWSLILLDVLFDSITELDFKTCNLQVHMSRHIIDAWY